MSFTGKEYYRDIIDRANSVPIEKVFKSYGLRLNAHNIRICCPFKSHKGGRESTPSFNFYPDTNSYFCFGCKVGNRACDFVSEMDRISKSAAAEKILKLFSEDVDEDHIFDRQNFSQKLEIMMEFSNCVRDFLQQNTDQKSMEFIEHICSIYDDLNLMHKNFSNEALRSVVDKLKEEISSYNV